MFSFTSGTTEQKASSAFAGTLLVRSVRGETSWSKLHIPSCWSKRAVSFLSRSGCLGILFLTFLLHLNVEEMLMQAQWSWMWLERHRSFVPYLWCDVTVFFRCMSDWTKYSISYLCCILYLFFKVLFCIFTYLDDFSLRSFALHPVQVSQLHEYLMGIFDLSYFIFNSWKPFVWLVASDLIVPLKNAWWKSLLGIQKLK